MIVNEWRAIVHIDFNCVQGGIVHVQYEVLNPPPFFPVIGILSFPTRVATWIQLSGLPNRFTLNPPTFHVLLVCQLIPLVYF